MLEPPLLRFLRGVMPSVSDLGDSEDFGIFEKVGVALSQLLQKSKMPYIWDSKTKSNWTEQSVNYSESEKRFKAFIEHDLVWALIVQSYFLWQQATAW